MTNEIWTTIIVAILTTIITLIGYKFQFFSKPKKELEHLKLQFRMNQELSFKVQTNIEKLIKDYNLGNEYIFDGMKYKAYYNELIKHQKESLSNERYSELDLFKKNKEIILSATRNLESQFSALNQVHIQTNIKLDEIKNN